jgi:hypothetical protein
MNIYVLTSAAAALALTVLALLDGNKMAEVFATEEALVTKTQQLHDACVKAGCTGHDKSANMCCKSFSFGPATNAGLKSLLSFLVLGGFEFATVQYYAATHSQQLSGIQVINQPI